MNYRPMSVRLHLGNYQQRLLNLLARMTLELRTTEPEACVSRKALIERATNGTRTEVVYQKNAEPRNHCDALDELFDHLKLTGLITHHRNGTASLTADGERFFAMAGTRAIPQLLIPLTDADVLSIRAAYEHDKFDLVLWAMQKANYKHRLFDSENAMKRQLARLEALGLARHSMNGYFHLSEVGTSLAINFDAPAETTEGKAAAATEALTRSLSELLTAFNDLRAGYPEAELNPTPQALQDAAVKALALGRSQPEAHIRQEFRIEA